MSEVRRATVEDADTLGRLLHAFNVEFATGTDSAEVLARRFRWLLDGPAAFAVIGDDGAGATGFGLVTLRPAIWYDGPVATLDELYVVPSRRGVGIGTALLEAARAGARGSGSPEMHVNVDEVDDGARRFYERHGFVNVEPGTAYRMLCYVGPTR